MNSSSLSHLRSILHACILRPITAERVLTGTSLNLAKKYYQHEGMKTDIHQPEKLQRVT